MRQLSRNFLKSISIDILEAMNWSKDESIHDSEVERCIIHDNSSSIGSKYSFTSHDNPLALQSKYHILDSHNINSFTLKEDPLDIVYLKNLLSEVSCVFKDNIINIHLEKWGGRGKAIDSNSF